MQIISNAIIESFEIYPEKYNISIHFKLKINDNYKKQIYISCKPESPQFGICLMNLFMITDAKSLSEIEGKYVRIRFENSDKIDQLGHIISDVWRNFNETD